MNVQLTLKQHGFELHGSIYRKIFSNQMQIENTVFAECEPKCKEGQLFMYIGSTELTTGLEYTGFGYMLGAEEF